MLRFSRGEKNCRYYLARDRSLSDLASLAPTQWRLTEINSNHEPVPVYKYSESDAFEDITNLRSPSEFVLFHPLEEA